MTAFGKVGLKWQQGPKPANADRTELPLAAPHFDHWMTWIINTPPEPFRPTDVPFGGYKTETKDLGGIFGCKIDFWL